MNAWFGEPWPSEQERAPVCEDDTQRIPTPVGELCLFCTEPIAGQDRGETIGTLDGIGFCHIECIMRQVLGGPAHLLGLCSCQGGDREPDLGMAPRVAAQWVWDWTVRRGAA